MDDKKEMDLQQQKHTMKVPKAFLKGDIFKAKAKFLREDLGVKVMVSCKTRRLTLAGDDAKVQQARQHVEQVLQAWLDCPAELATVPLQQEQSLQACPASAVDSAPSHVPQLLQPVHGRRTVVARRRLVHKATDANTSSEMKPVQGRRIMLARRRLANKTTATDMSSEFMQQSKLEDKTTNDVLQRKTLKAKRRVTKQEENHKSTNDESQSCLALVQRPSMSVVSLPCPALVARPSQVLVPVTCPALRFNRNNLILLVTPRALLSDACKVTLH